MAGMRFLSLNLETFSDVDLSKCGLYRYVEGDFHILLFAYAFDDEEPRIVDMACGEQIPQEVLDAIDDPEIIKAAWNAQFERTCIGHYLGRVLSPDSWRCSMVHAASLSLPLALKNAAKVLKTGEQKDKAGENLIKYFSVPCKPTKANGGRTRNLPEHDPEKWRQFKGYCLQDVRTERDIRKRLEMFPMPDREWDFYHMDQRINDRGVRIDTELVEKAISCDLMLSEEMSKRAYSLTGLETPNSVSQLKGWLEGRGIPVETLGKKDVAAMITDLDKNSCDQEALDMLKLRLQMAKSSVKKYQAAERCVCSDGRAHGLFQFYGASRTGRFAGRHIQLQNLPQNHISTLDEARELVKMDELGMLESIYGNVPDILSQLIRTMLVPKEGCEFIVADFSAIEARVLAWLAGEQWRLDAFKNGEDIYCASASQMFGVPVVKHGINGELRQKGKISELACGYQGGNGALISMGALDMGLKESELPDIIEQWRSASPHIVQFWWDMEKAAVDTVRDHQEHTVGKVRFQFYSGTLWMVLPGGRKLAYLKPRLESNRFGRMSLTFEGGGGSGGSGSGGWSRQETYGGKLTENCVAEGTTVLTDRGLIAIEEIKDGDLIWDGVDWVRHEGLISKGIQETVSAGDIHLTPNHKILTEKGWVECGEADRLNWARVRLPYGFGEDSEWEMGRNQMAMPMWVRETNKRVFGRTDRDWGDDSSLSAGSQLADRISVRPTGCTERVYDIRNCGPRHRFAVYDPGAGKFRIVSNCTQATARDILAEAMWRLEKAGFEIVGHVHDEVIIEAPIGKYTVDEVCSLMAQNPGWCPDCPLAAAGYLAPNYYFKD